MSKQNRSWLTPPRPITPTGLSTPTTPNPDTISVLVKKSVMEFVAAYLNGNDFVTLSGVVDYIVENDPHLLSHDDTGKILKKAKKKIKKLTKQIE